MGFGDMPGNENADMAGDENADRRTDGRTDGGGQNAKKM